MGTTPSMTLQERLQSAAAAASASPGMYNSTCGPFLPCYTQFNLQCLEGRCVCLPNYSPDTSGGCEDNLSQLMLNWTVRLTIVVCLFFLCIMILHVTLRRERCCEGNRGSQGAVLEEEGSHRPRTRWHDDPPSYVEVVEPPPSYYEAVVKVGQGDEQMRPGFFKVPSRDHDLEYPVCTARVETPAAVTCSEEGPSMVTGSWQVVAREDPTSDKDSPENGRPRVNRSDRKASCKSNVPSPASHTDLQLYI